MLPWPLLKNIDFPLTKASPLLVDGWRDGWRDGQRDGQTDTVVVMRLSRHEDETNLIMEASCMRATKHCIIA